MELDEFLEHHGIKGMHWGIRHDPKTGVPRSTDRHAKKDAQEFARAKLFFGEGAGTRRKLIKATVEAKKKKDPSYAKAFDQHLAEQDLSKHASKARSERSRKDKSKTAKRTSGALARRFTGEMGTNAAFTAVALAGAGYVASPQGQAAMKTIVRRIKAFRMPDGLNKDIADLINRSRR